MDFAFNANALAAGGVIERGNAISTLQGLGSIVLPPTGGEGRTEVSNYYSDALELAHAETRVSARRFVERNARTGEDETRFVTWTSVLMKGVSIFGRVHVGEMGTTITSTRGLEDDDDHEFRIRIWFRDVRIGESKLEIRVDSGLERMKRYGELQARLKSEPAAATHLSARLDARPEDLDRAVKERKHVRVSLVERIEGWEAPSVGTIFVRGIGTLTFGELMLKPGQRRVNLIRATLGARKQRLEQDGGETLRRAEGSFFDGPTGGSMILGSGEGNGTPIEP